MLTGTILWIDSLLLSVTVKRLVTHGRCRLIADGYTFERMIEQESEHFGISIDSTLLPGKHPYRVKARSIVAYLAVRRLGMDGTTVGMRMGVGQSAISRAVTRGEKLLRELEISFPW